MLGRHSKSWVLTGCMLDKDPTAVQVCIAVHVPCVFCCVDNTGFLRECCRACSGFPYVHTLSPFHLCVAVSSHSMGSVGRAVTVQSVDGLLYCRPTHVIATQFRLQQAARTYKQREHAVKMGYIHNSALCTCMHALQPAHNNRLSTQSLLARVSSKQPATSHKTV